MERNGSPKPTFETDDSNYVLVTLDIHPEFLKSDQANDQANTITLNTLEKLSNYLDSTND